MALKCGEYAMVQKDANSPETSVSFLETKKFRFSSSSSVSKGFYEYYVDHTAKGKWKYDKTKSFIMCVATKAKCTKWNTDNGDEDVTKLPEWSRTFSVDDLQDSTKYRYSPPVDSASPPSTASSDSRPTTAGSITGYEDLSGGTAVRTAEPRPPSGSSTEGEPRPRSRPKSKGSSHSGQELGAIIGRAGQRRVKKHPGAIPPTVPIPTGPKRPGSHEGAPSTPRGSKASDIEAARVRDGQMNGNVRVGNPVPKSKMRSNGSAGFSSTRFEDQDQDQDSDPCEEEEKASPFTLTGKSKLSDEEMNLLSTQEQAFLTKKFLEHKIQKAQSRVDEAREEFNAAKTALAKLKRSYRQASIVKKPK